MTFFYSQLITSIHCTFFPSLPWNQLTVPGWIAEISISLATALSYTTSDFTFLTFFVVIGQFHQAFRRQFPNMMTNLDSKQIDYQQAKESIRETIRFHISVEG